MEPATDPQVKIRKEFERDWNQMVDDGLLPGEPHVNPSEPVAVEAKKEGSEAPPTKAPAEPKESTPPAEAGEEPRKFADKYNSVAELEQGYAHLNTLAQKMAAENRQFREQGTGDPVPAHDPRSQAAPEATPSSVVDWSSNPAVKAFSEGTGAEPHIARDLAQGIYDSVVREAVSAAQTAAQEAVAPLYAQGEADQYMQGKYPEAFKFTPELATYMETADPVTKATFRNLVEAKNYAGASSYAWLTYKEDSGLSKQGSLKAEAKITETERADSKANAGVTASQPGTSPRDAKVADEGYTNAQILELAQKARTSGDQKDQKAYRDATIGKMLKADPQFQKMLANHNREYGLT